MIAVSKNYKVGAQITDISDLGALASSGRSVVSQVQNKYEIRPAAFYMNWPLRMILNRKFFYPVEMTSLEKELAEAQEKVKEIEKKIFLEELESRPKDPFAFDFTEEWPQNENTIKEIVGNTFNVATTLIMLKNKYGK